MKGLFMPLILVVVGVVGLGFYRNWYNLSSKSSDNKVHIQLTVDKDKIQEDKQAALEKVQALGHKAKDKATATEKSKDEESQREPPNNP